MRSGRADRILFVDHATIAGGAQLVLASHVRALDKEAFEPHVACTGDVPALVERFRDAGARVHLIEMPRLRGSLPAALVRLVPGVWRLRQLIRREGIDLVVANTERATYVSSLAILGTGVPLIWWVRDFGYSKRLFGLLRRIPRGVIFVSDALRRFYEPEHRSDAVVWPVASDLDQRLPDITPAMMRAERAKYGFSPEHVVVGFMGRLVAQKGPEDVVAAIDILSREVPDLRALIVGTGAGQPNDVEPALRESVVSRGLVDRIRFAGFQQNEALYYSLFDIFVIATRDYEAYPTSAVQAMMCGKVVLATAIGGIPEIVRDGVTGLHFLPGSPEALAQAVRRVLRDPDLSSRLADAGRRFVFENNCEAPAARRAEGLYEVVLSRTQAGGRSFRR